MFVMSRSPFAVRLLCRLASLLLVASLLPASAQLRDPVSFPREVIRLPNLRIVGFYNEAGTLLPRNTPTLSGSVVVRVQLPEPLQIERPGGNNPPPAPYAYEYSDITLHFDNEDVNLAGDYILNANGARFVEMELDTTEYANGLHTLAVSDRHGFRDAVTVTITNRASSFFAEPVFDLDLFNGDVPTACQITASLEVAQAWTVEIRSTTDTPTLVRSFSGNSATINLSWDGLDANGNEVEDDTYDVVLTLVNSPGQGSKKQVNKKRGIGDAFILLQKDVFPGPGKQESDRKRNEYE